MGLGEVGVYGGELGEGVELIVVIMCNRVMLMNWTSKLVIVCVCVFVCSCVSVEW